MSDNHERKWTTTLTNLPRLDPDVALVRQFKATGNAALFEALFRKYQNAIFRLVNNMVNGEDAYDVTQEVFLRALRSLQSFKGDSKFSTWLYTIAKNTCLNYIRDNKRNETFAGYSLDQSVDPDDGGCVRQLPDPKSDIHHIVETRELQETVAKVLTTMTPEQRMLITLRDLEGLSYDEIAAITGYSDANVKSKIHRSRLAFKARFEPYIDAIDPCLEAGTRRSI